MNEFLSIIKGLVTIIVIVAIPVWLISECLSIPILMVAFFAVFFIGLIVFLWWNTKDN